MRKILWLFVVAETMLPTFRMYGLPDYTYLSTAHDDCAFCAIVSGQAPATVIYETPEIVVSKKRHVTQGIDCLILPKKHIENLFDFVCCGPLANPYDAALMNKIVEVALHLSTMMTGSGHFSLLNNNGKDAQQTVFHMHWHFKAPKSRWKAEVQMQRIQ